MNNYEVILRLILAIIVGGVIGYEREFKNRPAGFRTHILVCVGAAVISMIQLYVIDETSTMILQHPQLESALKTDIGRMGAQVITGIGFLGAGTIIHEKGAVKGLTTAATIWVVACIGLAVGLGYYFLSVASTIGVFIVLVSFKDVEDKLFVKNTVVKLEIEYFHKKDFLKEIEEYFDSKGIKVKNIDFALEEEEKSERISLYTILLPRHIKSSKVVQDLCHNEQVLRVTVL